MELIESVSISTLQKMSEKMYDALVKGVVDVDQGLLVLDASMHADEELFLLQNGSSQESLWGINLYPDEYGTDEFIEFDSMNNIRPAQGNRSRGVEDEAIRLRIKDLVESKVHE